MGAGVRAAGRGAGDIDQDDRQILLAEGAGERRDPPGDPGRGMGGRQGDDALLMHGPHGGYACPHREQHAGVKEGIRHRVEQPDAGGIATSPTGQDAVEDV